MGYWQELYGECSREFVDGVIAGVRAYAVWKDGKQYVGIVRMPLEEAIKQIERDLLPKSE